jgi:hypothetical protein
VIRVAGVHRPDGNTRLELKRSSLQVTSFGKQFCEACVAASAGE